MTDARKGLAVALFALAAAASAQEKPEAEPFRPPEGTIIINLPSAQVSAPRTLQLQITHRFAQPLSEANIHNLFTFDSGADVELGLSYVPVRNLEVGFLRSRSLEDYEMWAKYRLFGAPDAPGDLAVRFGIDARTQETPDLCVEPRTEVCSFADHKTSVFAQAIAAVTLWNRVRLTAVPTFITYSAQQPFVINPSVHKDIFNVPFAASIAVTRSVNIQAEVVPRMSRAQAQGVGWICAVEKTVLRHRFAFTVGNLRPTTVDQYIGSDFLRRPADYFIGFNIIRQWKL